MTTSYFAKNGNSLNAVSIAGKNPLWYEGRSYRKLAPQYEWWKEWKYNNKSNDWYIQQYQKNVLDKLDPKKVYEELGKDAILICWEGPDKFCHRHLVAKWFEKELNIKIEEKE